MYYGKAVSHSTIMYHVKRVIQKISVSLMVSKSVCQSVSYKTSISHKINVSVVNHIR